MGAKLDLFQQKKISDEKAYKFAESNGMKLKYVSAKENRIGIIDFIQELVSDYLLAFKDDIKLNKNEFIDKKRIRNKIKRSEEKKILDNKRIKELFSEKLDKHHIKNLTKYNSY